MADTLTDTLNETLRIHSNIEEQLGLKKCKVVHDLKLENGSIIKEIIDRKLTDFLACRIKLEPMKPCISSNSGLGLEESISGL